MLKFTVPVLPSEHPVRENSIVPFIFRCIRSDDDNGDFFFFHFVSFWYVMLGGWSDHLPPSLAGWEGSGKGSVTPDF